MSYDMSIADEEFNYTYNVSPMWYDAIPDTGIRTHYGMTGREALTPLHKIAEHMANNAERLREMNPKNGWGDFDSALAFVHRLIQASVRNPDDVWEGD